MSDRRRSATRWLAPAVVLVVASGVGRTADAPTPCCFTNERFAGVCQVVPEQDETCADILGYLNDPNSTGKTYCGSTTIRGGWTQVKCSEETPGPSGRAAGPAAPFAATSRIELTKSARPR